MKGRKTAPIVNDSIVALEIISTGGDGVTSLDTSVVGTGVGEGRVMGDSSVGSSGSSEGDLYGWSGGKK